MRAPFLILSLPLLAVLLASEVEARNFEQVRYALYLDPHAEVVPDLEQLAKLGDHRAQRLLGDILAERDPAGASRVLELYRQAFAGGRGEISALAAMARYLGQRPRLRQQHRAEVAEGLTRYRHDRDPVNVLATLEVFNAYPELFESAAVEHLISRYERACIENCLTLLYRGRLAEHQGNHELAESLYRQAALQDPRAIEALYRVMGKDVALKFRSFARDASPRIASLPIEVVHRIGLHLANTSNALANEWVYTRQSVIGEVEIPDAEQLAAAEAAQRAQDAMIDELDREILYWLDHAVARGYTPAMSTKASFMMAGNNRFSSEAVEHLLRQLESTETARSSAGEHYQDRVGPQRIKALWASYYMVNWLSMNPTKAHGLIRELIEEGYDDARLMEGDLYSRGLLDEPDQARALGIYEQMAERGWASAHLRIARLNTYGRAMRGDFVTAYSHARAALELGDLRAEGLVNFLEQRLPATLLEQGNAMTEQMLRNSVL